MRTRTSLILIGASALSGCSLLHSNIKGGFACAAPHGTCAPSMTIDDAAIRGIGGQDVRTGDGGEAPAPTNSELAKPVRSALPKSGTGKEWVFVPGDRPAIKVVFPAWRDGTGQVHPRTAAYAPVDLPQVPVAKAMPLNAGQMGAGEGTSLLAIAEMAPDVSLLGSAPAVTATVNDHVTGIGTPDAMPAGGNLQSTGAGSPGALDVIKDQVKHILSTTKKPPASPDVPNTGPAPVQSGASFPPKGS